MTCDVAIVGAGIVGCASARELARRGTEVVVVDRDRPGSHASWAAAGMLAPQAESDGDSPFLRIALQARRIFPELCAELQTETSLDLGYRTEGMLFVGTADDARELEATYHWQREAGLAVDLLDGPQARDLEPALADSIEAALLFPGDHQIENRQLTQALWFSANRAGARFEIGDGARRLEPTTVGFRLFLDSGEMLEAARVVVAAGAWSGSLAGLPRPLPVEPVYGQLIALQTDPSLFARTVASHHGYLVPRADGRLIVGATVKRVGFKEGVTAEGREMLLECAGRMSPRLTDCPLIDHWSGLRPGTPDDLPILGPDPDLPGLIYATGHFRNGILLGPLTGRIVADLITEGRSEHDLAPFSVARFASL